MSAIKAGFSGWKRAELRAKREVLLTSDQLEYVRGITSNRHPIDDWIFVQTRNETAEYPLARLKAVERRIGKPELPDIEPAPPLVLVHPHDEETQWEQ